MPTRVFAERERELLQEVVDAGKLSCLAGGEFVPEFEAAFAAAHGAQHGVAMNSAMSSCTPQRSPREQARAMRYCVTRSVCSGP